VSENCAETRRNFPLTPAGRGHRPLFMLLVRLSGDPLARSWSDFEAIAVHCQKQGGQNGNPR
jgi:hypothetical protein